MPLLLLVHATGGDVTVEVCVGTLQSFQSVILQLIGVHQSLSTMDCGLGRWLHLRKFCVLLLDLDLGLVFAWLRMIRSDHWSLLRHRRLLLLQLAVVPWILYSLLNMEAHKGRRSASVLFQQLVLVQIRQVRLLRCQLVQGQLHR